MFENRTKNKKSEIKSNEFKNIIEIDESPEIKGAEFENFVYDEIFNDKLFDVVEKTNDFDSNSRRFEERSMNPDFCFRDKRTREKFWIEAKYRKSLSKNENGEFICKMCTRKQLDKYKDVEERTKIKVYICLGLGGDPKSPETVYLIPVVDAHPYLFQSVLKETLMWENPNFK